MARFREKGKIKALGVSNFSREQLLEAVQMTRVDAIQVRFNMLDRDHALSILPVCRQYGITPVFYGVLADGLLTGKFSATTKFGTDDHRSRSQDFQGERFLNNLRIVEAIRSTEAAKKVSIGQIALRWVLEEIECAAVLFGAKTTDQMEENLYAEQISLSESDHRFISDLHTSLWRSL